jgi:hypothetical protein
MLKNNSKKIVLLTLLCCVVSLAIFSFTNKQQDPIKFKNLKVLPKDISDDDLDHIMDNFKESLGVKCGFCHAPSKENPKKLDMASDDNPRKDITREMMRMTQEMNQKYISKIPHADTVKLQMVTCNTCHRGATKPFGEPHVKPKQ